MEASGAEKTGTSYLVLQRYEADGPEAASMVGAQHWWIERETVVARSARDAVAAYVRKNGNSGGEFVAAPKRNFQAISVTPETQTRLRFS